MLRLSPHPRRAPEAATDVSDAEPNAESDAASEAPAVVEQTSSPRERHTPGPRRIVSRYRVTCLTPTLVGDGYKLSPIDYMVWRDQVNVLDQTRIFKLLAKGPRLDGYLTQIKKATKLDFASWGGFAQNYAGRRIPFESAASSKYWERAATEQLAIPTFASGPSGPYLPASAAIKGARCARSCSLWLHQRQHPARHRRARHRRPSIASSRRSARKPTGRYQRQ